MLPRFNNGPVAHRRLVMPLRISYPKKEDVPEALASLYVEKDGAWVLEVDGMVPSGELATLKTRLDDFRTNNISLTEKLKGFDGKKLLTQEEVEEFARLAEQEQGLKDKKLIDAGKLDELLASRTEKMRNDFDAQLKSLKDSLTASKDIAALHEGRLSSVLVESEVGRLMSASGNRPIQGAMSDIFARAGSVWKVNDQGTLVALDAKGEQLYGSEANALTMDEWLVTTVKDAPYLFEGNKGSGGDGNKGGGDKGSDGIIRIPRSDERLKGLHVEDIATGKAVIVDG